MPLRPFLSLRGLVVVITGASSGIGRATALAFARRGARLVLAARREAPLQATAEDCRRLGAEAVARPTDVTDAAAVTALAHAAAADFGRIDVWINNAGTGLLGPFVAGEVAAHRRVVEINLLGAMHGTHAVLPHFLRHGRGVVLNTVSIGAFTPVPFAAAYAASKAGLRAFIASVRPEFARFPGIRLCGVYPTVVDTPGFRHGANVSGHALRASGPILPPGAVAEALVQAVLNPRDEIPVGWSSAIARRAYGLAPGLTEHIAGAVMRRYVRRGAPAPLTSGNLFAPVAAGTGSSDGWRRRAESTRRRRTSALVALAAGAGLAYVLRRRARARPAPPAAAFVH